MPRRPSNLTMSLAEEQALIARAQAGDKKASDALVIGNLRFIHNLAAALVRWIIWRRKAERDVEVDELVSVGVTEFIEKIQTYDATKANGARLRSHAYRNMRNAMVQYACDGLEIVRLARNPKVHAAHRRIDQGEPVDEVARDLRLSPDVARSIYHTTISDTVLHDEQHEIASEHEVDSVLHERQEHGELLAETWERFDSIERMVIALRYLDVRNVTRRARVVGLTPRALRWLEARILERARGGE